MKNTIRIREDDLQNELQKFNNKDIKISFTGKFNGYTNLNQIKSEIKDFDVCIYDNSKASFKFDLSYIDEIRKSLDNTGLCFKVEQFGIIEIVRI